MKSVGTIAAILALLLVSGSAMAHENVEQQARLLVATANGEVVLAHSGIEPRAVGNRRGKPVSVDDGPGSGGCGGKVVMIDVGPSISFGAQ